MKTYRYRDCIPSVPEDLKEFIKGMPEDAHIVAQEDMISAFWWEEETPEEEDARLESEKLSVIREEQRELRLLAELKKKYNK
jgi:hypothetical protein